MSFLPPLPLLLLPLLLLPLPLSSPPSPPPLLPHSLHLILASPSSIVGLGDNRRTMGTSARNQLVMNPKSTVWGFKNLIGRSFSDPFVETERQRLPYDIEELGKDGVGIKVCTLYCGSLGRKSNIECHVPATISYLSSVLLCSNCFSVSIAVQ